jgi:hypothetical protein
MREIVVWRSIGRVCVNKVIIVIEKRDVGLDLEYARLEVDGGSGGHYTVLCRDREYYGRIVEGDMYWLYGAVELDTTSGLILVAEELYGGDGLLLLNEESEYFFNLNPIEIGDLV